MYSNYSRTATFGIYGVISTVSVTMVILELSQVYSGQDPFIDYNSRCYLALLCILYVRVAVMCLWHAGTHLPVFNNFALSNVYYGRAQVDPKPSPFVQATSVHQLVGQLEGDHSTSTWWWHFMWKQPDMNRTRDLIHKANVTFTGT